MTRAGFYLARSLHNDAALMRLSVDQQALLAQLAGKSAALVGNARALAQTRHGKHIDQHDVVIRINRALMPAPTSHGTRTDWLALATRLRAADRARLQPPRILWMSPKRKRLDWASACSTGFYLHPLADYRTLRDRLMAPPTTGAMMIALLARGDLAHLTLFGFDFFASQSLSGRRRASQVPHDFETEGAWARDLVAADDRISWV